MDQKIQYYENRTFPFLFEYTNVNWIHQAFLCERNRWDALKHDQYTTCTTLLIVNISATGTYFFGDDSVAQLIAPMFGLVLNGVVEVAGSNLARGEI